MILLKALFYLVINFVIIALGIKQAKERNENHWSMSGKIILIEMLVGVVVGIITSL